MYREERWSWTGDVVDERLAALVPWTYAVLDVVALGVAPKELLPVLQVEADVDLAELRITRRLDELTEEEAEKARRSRKPHNAARVVFVKEALSDVWDDEPASPPATSETQW